MPRTCTICNHPDRAEIDKALLAGEPFRKIAKRTETSITSLFRHRNEHIPTALAVAKQAAEVDYGDDLFAHVKDLNARTMRILEQAEASGDPRIALAAIQQARGNSELLCKMIVAAVVHKPKASDPNIAAHLVELMEMHQYGCDWRRKRAERNEKIRRGEPVECNNCHQLYVAPPGEIYVPRSIEDGGIP